MTRRPNTEARTCLLRSAFQLFCRKGFKGVSVDDVARAAGMKKANVFHYYPNKESLGQAAFDVGAQEARERFSSFLSRGQGDPVRSVEALFEQMICALKEDCCDGGCFIGNTAQEMSGEDESLRQKTAQQLEAWVHELKGLLSSRRASGYFRPTLDPQGTAQAILALYEGGILLSKAARHTEALESARRVAVEYLQVHRT